MFKKIMVPLDGSIVERCKSIAARQEAKMALDYELVRAKECASLQQKGFMLLPGSRVYHMCSDIIPISAWNKAQAKIPHPIVITTVKLKHYRSYFIKSFFVWTNHY